MSRLCLLPLWTDVVVKVVSFPFSPGIPPPFDMAATIVYRSGVSSKLGPKLPTLQNEVGGARGFKLHGRCLHHFCHPWASRASSGAFPVLPSLEVYWVLLVKHIVHGVDITKTTVKTTCVRCRQEQNHRAPRMWAKPGIRE